jgi:dipeptidase E
MRLLLISNSTMFGRGYLDHAEQEIRLALRGARRVAFVPYALKDHAGYAAKARDRFAALGLELISVHEGDPRALVESADAVFIGGGNTFRLLKALYDTRLVEAIPARVRAGMPYLGASAGSNVAAPTIRTTNDMPVVEPPSLNALNLVPFQINPHYLDPDPASKHMGETREERLLQFLEENETPVVAMREGAMLRVEDAAVTLLGTTGARIFRRGRAPEEAEPGIQLRL